MGKKIILFLVVALFVIYPLAAKATEGFYISQPIGEKKLESFQSFITINQNKPVGTEIKYSFSGSADNYSNWSPEISHNEGLPLSNISQLKNSDYLKVKIFAFFGKFCH